MLFPLTTYKTLYRPVISCLVFLLALVASVSGQDRPQERRPEEQRDERRYERRDDRRDEPRSGLTITDPIRHDGERLVAPGSVDISFSVNSDEIEKVKVQVVSENYDGSSKIEKI